MSSSPTYVSVFVPTFNGANQIRETLDAVLSQRLPPSCKLDLLVIDSGSTDGTLEILRAYQDNLRLLQIPNQEFSHGGTRDRAARMARGEFVLYLSQDATPVNDRWLISLIEPFFLSEQVGCVYGAQWPRNGAPVAISREVRSAFELSRGDIVLSRTGSLVDAVRDTPLDTFFSDVNSAVRRDVVIGTVPFRHVAYAEDQALAQDMQLNGYLKAYAPHAAVWHSNDCSFIKYYSRKRDDYVGWAHSTGGKLSDSIPSLLLGWLRPTLLDWFYLMQTRESGAAMCSQIIMSPLYNAAHKAARYFAYRQLQRERLSVGRTE